MLDDRIILLKIFASDFTYFSKNDVKLTTFLSKIINEIKLRY